MDELTLNCWIRSDDPEAYFCVKIPNTYTVLDLQEAIKNKKPAAFRDVDPDVLALYKPKTAVSKPYKEHLSKLILSEHGEFLERGDELSEIFPEPPPKRDIHVIVDAPSRIVCWLRGADLNDRLPISIRPGEGIETLIPRICAHPNLRSIADTPIHLYKISGNEKELRECLNETGGGEQLREDGLARNFLDVPVLDPLRVVIETGENLSPTLVQEPIPHDNDLEKYRDIFLIVKDWGKLEESDIERNHIEEAGNIIIPVFVTTFEQKLLRKPHLDIPFDPRMQTMRISEEYFEPYQTSTARDPQEEIRRADPWEVTHTIFHIVPYKWELSWQRKQLKEPIMASIFFDPFLWVENKKNTAGSDESWPVDVVVKRDDPNDNERRKYRPRSGFLISNSTLPRLLVEVNSTPPGPHPQDLRRMLAAGAFVVRFANKFVSTFKEKKNFVLCTFYISSNGAATRYNLFQIPNNEKVYYTRKTFWLGDALGRVEFARHLYNLRAELDKSEDKAVMDAVKKLCHEVSQRHMELMFSKSVTGRAKKRKRTEGNDDDPAYGGGGNGHTAQLRAHGYEVEPKVFVDDSGGTWESLSKTPDHVLTVYRPTNPNKMFIAKKVREESDELEILKLLNNTRHKSDYVISLVDSFDGWAILPKMATLKGYLDSRPKVFESKVSQVCLGLIEGVAYLHRHHIAHRDIKPDNLVVDKNFTLQIIDFDVATQVENEDEEVDDQCGTRYWMPPEVEKKLRHSPIKADRWSCGRVLLFLLDVFGKEEISLRAFARNLMAHNPKQRPSLVEWRRYLAPPFSDSGNIGNSDAGKTSQLRRDRVEGDGEITKPSNVKKQRLDSGLGGFRGRYGLGLVAGPHVELVKQPLLV